MIMMDIYRPVLVALVLCRSVRNGRSKMYSPRKLVDCPTTNEYLANSLRSCVTHRHDPPVDSNITHTMDRGLLACIEPTTTISSTFPFNSLFKQT